jgi:hypothetical protein
MSLELLLGRKLGITRNLEPLDVLRVAVLLLVDGDLDVRNEVFELIQGPSQPAIGHGARSATFDLWAYRSFAGGR